MSPARLPHRSLSAAALGLLLSPWGAAMAQDRVIDSLTRRHMAEWRIPGAQVAVIERGRVVHVGAYGLADLAHRVPVRATTRFSIASATKSFSGVALWRLVEAGRLTLDAPVSQYVDDLPAAWRAVTIRQLATHTSGLPDVVDPLTGALLGPSPDSAWARVQREPMRGDPGTSWSYNQTNYWLLGRVVERVTGRPFTDVVAEQFSQVGMPATAYGDIHDVQPNQSASYTVFRVVGDSMVRDTTRRLLISEFPAPLRMAGGINTSATDLARWLVALTSGRLLRGAQALDSLWASPRMANGRILGAGEPNGYGIGWPTFDDPAHPSAAGIGGGRAAFFVYRRDGLAVIVLTNLQGARPEQLAQRIATHRLAARAR